MSFKPRKYKKRSRKLSKKQLYSLAIVTLVVVSLLAVYAFYNQPDNEFKATIIDQLSLTAPNQTFVETANKTLTTSGYQVTYYKGSDVNVDFYQQLPQNGYKILLFRVHSALRLDNNGNLTAPLDLFTSEPYTPANEAKHETYLVPPSNWLDEVMYFEGGEKYFGITSDFVTHATWGSFQNATIILMGCNGLDSQGRSAAMLQALVGKGAKVVIGWDALVSADHTDIAIERLLYHLLIENKTVEDAVTATNNEIKPDTVAKNELRYYPSSSGNYIIPHGPSKSAATKIGGDCILPSSNEGFLALPLLFSVMGLVAFEKFRRKTSSIFQSVSIQRGINYPAIRCPKA
jgi:hypothetical protein